MTTTPRHEFAVWANYEASADDVAEAPLVDHGRPDTDAKDTDADDTEAGYIEVRLERDLGHAPSTAPVGDAAQDTAYESDWHTDADAWAVGMPGRGIILLATTSLVLVAVADVALTQRISMFFDLCFVVICLVAAMGVRRSDLFTPGVLPPLVLGVVLVGVAAMRPDALGAAQGLANSFLVGLANHAGALVGGYAVSLAIVAARAFSART